MKPLKQANDKEIYMLHKTLAINFFEGDGEP